MKPHSDFEKMPSLRDQRMLRSWIEPAILQRSSTKQQPRNMSEQVNIRQIKFKAYHPTSVLVNPNGTAPEGSQPSKNTGEVAEALPTPLARD